MKETRVASRYAKALFELAIEMKLLDQVKKDMDLVLSVCQENRNFLLMLKSPVIKEAKKKSILKEIFEKKLNKLTFKFLMVIATNRREQLIHVISEQFIIIYKEYKNILPTLLTTAATLDGTTRDRIVAIMGERSKSEIELTEVVKEEIIGGFIIEANNLQFDASILRKIKKLRKEFDINLYVKGF